MNLYIFYLLVAILIHISVNSTTDICSSTNRTRIICPDDKPIFVCNVSSNPQQQLTVYWLIDELIESMFIPGITPMNSEYSQHSFSIFVPQDDRIISYLHLLKLPESDQFQVICYYDTDVEFLVVVQGKHPLPALAINKNYLKYGVELSWPNNFTNRVQHYEVMLDNEPYTKVKDTRVVILIDWNNTSHKVTVTPIDHCNMPGITTSLQVCGPITLQNQLKNTKTPSSQSANTQEAGKRRHTYKIAIAILFITSIHLVIYIIKECKETDITNAKTDHKAISVKSS